MKTTILIFLLVVVLTIVIFCFVKWSSDFCQQLVNKIYEMVNFRKNLVVKSSSLICLLSFCYFLIRYVSTIWKYALLKIVQVKMKKWSVKTWNSTSKFSLLSLDIVIVMRPIDVSATNPLWKLISRIRRRHNEPHSNLVPRQIKSKSAW